MALLETGQQNAVYCVHCNLLKNFSCQQSKSSLHNDLASACWGRLLPRWQSLTTARQMPALGGKQRCPLRVCMSAGNQCSLSITTPTAAWPGGHLPCHVCSCLCHQARNKPPYKAAITKCIAGNFILQIVGQLVNAAWANSKAARCHTVCPQQQHSRTACLLSSRLT